MTREERDVRKVPVGDLGLVYGRYTRRFIRQVAKAERLGSTRERQDKILATTRVLIQLERRIDEPGGIPSKIVREISKAELQARVTKMAPGSGLVVVA